VVRLIPSATKSMISMLKINFHLPNLLVSYNHIYLQTLVEDLISNTLPDTFEIEKGPKVK
jgi:hypothetical protein